MIAISKPALSRRAVMAGLALLAAPAAARAMDTIPAACQPDAPPASRVDRVISLRRLEAHLTGCGTPPACDGDAATLFGMTRVTGFVVDPTGHDILLCGVREKGAQALRLDDFLVALRSALRLYVHREGGQTYYSPPAVSIDPDPAVALRLQTMLGGRSDGAPAILDRLLVDWRKECELAERVRIMGVPSDCTFTRALVLADALLKRISDGSAPLDGIDPLTRRWLREAIEAARTAQPYTSASMSRFWFTPGANQTYRDDGRTYLLDRVDVALLTEAEQLTREGRIGASGRTDALAEAYACDMSRLFPRLAAVGSPYPIFAELEAMFRWVALCRIIVDGPAFTAASYRPDFLIDEYPYTRVEVPRTVNGVANVQRWDNERVDGARRITYHLRLPSCGGVEIDYERRPMARVADGTDRLPRLGRAMQASRPVQPAIWWPVPLI